MVVRCIGYSSRVDQRVRGLRDVEVRSGRKRSVIGDYMIVRTEPQRSRNTERTKRCIGLCKAGNESDIYADVVIDSCLDNGVSDARVSWFVISVSQYPQTCIQSTGGCGG